MTTFLTTIIGLLLMALITLLAAPPQIEHVTIIHKERPMWLPVPIEPSKFNSPRGYALQ